MKFAATTLAFALAALMGATSTFAAETVPAKTLTPQQQKMKDCNAQATEQKLAGDARKSFMSTCLKGSSTAAAAPPKQVTQREKMKVCNAQAGEKHLAGDERKNFMSTCLKGSTATTPAPAAAH
jgi:hypothetical protein